MSLKTGKACPTAQGGEKQHSALRSHAVLDTPEKEACDQ